MDKNTNFKNQKKFRLAPSLLDTGPKCPWASGTTYWFFWSCWFLLSGSLLSSQQMGPSRSWRFMPDREHLFSLDPSIVVAQHGTSSIAGMHQHASWCQCLVVLGKTMLDQKLADGTTCLLVHWHRTCLDGFNFPLQVCWESHGSTLSTSWHLDQTVFGWPGFP